MTLGPPCVSSLLSRGIVNMCKSDTLIDYAIVLLSVLNDDSSAQLQVQCVCLLQRNVYIRPYATHVYAVHILIYRQMAVRYLISDSHRQANTWLSTCRV